MRTTSIETFATVTFAVYDDTPIACQGDDDQKKIRVITDRIKGGGNVHAEALRRSLAMAGEHGAHVQVWDVQVDGALQK